MFKAIRDLLEHYAKAVDTVDLSLLSEIWSHSADVSFIYPLGEERGFDAIEQHVFQDVMGGMFSARDLQTRSVTVHVNGNAAWSEFHWVFHATMRKDASVVTTGGVETQIYRKKVRSGVWSMSTIPKIAVRRLEFELLRRKHPSARGSFLSVPAVVRKNAFRPYRYWIKRCKLCSTSAGWKP